MEVTGIEPFNLADLDPPDLLLASRIHKSHRLS